MFSGKHSTFPKMEKSGGSSGYDLENQKGLPLPNYVLNVDLKEYRMNFNWTPFAPTNAWYFFNRH